MLYVLTPALAERLLAAGLQRREEMGRSFSSLALFGANFLLAHLPVPPCIRASRPPGVLLTGEERAGCSAPTLLVATSPLQPVPGLGVPSIFFASLWTRRWR